jgi:hypothetical protein
MNNDLISRSALLADINSDREAAQVHHKSLRERLERFCDYAETLAEQAPAIDAAPVRHGRWIKWSTYMPVYGCSVCGERNLFRDGNNVFSNYCPNCGAKMDAEVE